MHPHRANRIMPTPDLMKAHPLFRPPANPPTSTLPAAYLLTPHLSPKKPVIPRNPALSRFVPVIRSTQKNRLPFLLLCGPASLRYGQKRRSNPHEHCLSTHFPFSFSHRREPEYEQRGENELCKFSQSGGSAHRPTENHPGRSRLELISLAGDSKAHCSRAAAVLLSGRFTTLLP